MFYEFTQIVVKKPIDYILDFQNFIDLAGYISGILWTKAYFDVMQTEKEDEYSQGFYTGEEQ